MAREAIIIEGDPPIVRKAGPTEVHQFVMEQKIGSSARVICWCGSQFELSGRNLGERINAWTAQHSACAPKE